MTSSTTTVTTEATKKSCHGRSSHTHPESGTPEMNVRFILLSAENT